MILCRIYSIFNGATRIKVGENPHEEAVPGLYGLTKRVADIQSRLAYISLFVMALFWFLVSGEYFPGIQGPSFFYERLEKIEVNQANLLTTKQFQQMLEESLPNQKQRDPGSFITKLSPSPAMTPDELRKLSLVMSKKAEEFRAAATKQELERKQAEIQRQMDELERKRKELASSNK